MGFVTDALFGWLGSKSESKAAQQSAQASTEATDKTLQFLRETRDQTRQDNLPWQQTGVNALNRLNALYGFNTPTTTPSTIPSTPPAAGGQGGQLGNLGNVLGGILQHGGLNGVQNSGGNLNALLGLTPQQQQQVQQYFTQQGGQTPQPQPSNTMNWLAMDPGYQFRLQQGENAVNTGYAARGMLQSGAAAKAMQDYAQNYASNEFGSAYNRLSNLAGLGQTANAQNQQAGQTFATGAGNALMQNAQNLGSSYTARGNAQAGFWGGLNGSLNSYGNLIGMVM